MSQFLYTVSEVFVITGRGIVAVPGIPPETPGIHSGASLELRRPDGSILFTFIESVAMVSPYDPKRAIQFSFPSDLTKCDVPVGTEVWLSDDASAA